MNKLVRPCHQCSTQWVDTAATSQCLHNKNGGYAGWDICCAFHLITDLQPFTILSISCWLEKTTRGPHTHWIDVVQHDLEWLGLDPNEVEKMAQNCRHWLSIVDLVGLMPRHEDWLIDFYTAKQWKVYSKNI